MAVIPRSPTRQRLPKWFKRSLAPAGTHAGHTNEVLKREKLTTVCEEATCPNQNECYSKKVAAFMLMGETCTRTCSFCDVNTKLLNLPPLDETEPERVAKAVGELGLKFAVVTSVNRDDMPTGGAEHFAATINAIREHNPDGLIEVLTPDFCGNWDALAVVCEARPDVFNHNMETIPRLYRTVRPQAEYNRSLEFLRRVKEFDPTIWTKSGIMVGLGETDDEIRWLMEDLRKQDVDIFTIGQYLRPSLQHHDVMRFVPPEEFGRYEQWGKELGFSHVAAGPFVRSSYYAEAVLDGAAEHMTLPPSATRGSQVEH
ncbi:MAG: lipoyl synthase [Okeania sp. SIO2C9]|uniref:lipoyl synthase n=1 Tax=Okeania sp. SIO2C9 TaxID=2607791 RepID=UPI0013BEF43A|nr:lipoyl synthase [Okeania sp. SIO2C9]NEQ78541.1 lipoyl synthase [Okeania sp. SIO2C9]